LISFDTNVLVRLIVQDDLDQAAIAEQRYRAAAETGEPIFLCDVVLVELVWVLGVTYRARDPRSSRRCKASSTTLSLFSRTAAPSRRGSTLTGRQTRISPTT
jgi:predicted nucleic acid-binding protein